MFSVSNDREPNCFIPIREGPLTVKYNVWKKYWVLVRWHINLRELWLSHGGQEGIFLHVCAIKINWGLLYRTLFSLVGSEGDLSVTSSASCNNGKSHRETNAKSHEQASCVTIWIFKKTCIHIMFIFLCVHQSGSRHKNRNFSKPFKLIQEIVTQEIEVWKSQTEWWGIPEISNSRKLLPLRAQGTQGRDCFVEMRSWGHPRGAWIMVESPRGSCATAGGAGLSLLPEMSQKAEMEGAKC